MAGRRKYVNLLAGQQSKKQWNVSSHLSHAYSVIYSMKQDSQGRLWMGIDDEGVLRYDPKNDTFKRIDLGMENIDVRTFTKMNKDKCG